MATLAELLVDELDGDLAKRRRELIDLRLMLSTASGARRDLLARSCVVMAYAHWEGFVKKAVTEYLNHLVRLRLPVASLRYPLQANAIRTPVKTAASAERSVAELVRLLETVDARGSMTFDVDPEEIVRIGNLTSTNLRVLLECVGLDYLPHYATRENYIDNVICGRRHRVAHGTLQPVQWTEARSVAIDVLDLCSTVNDQVQRAAVYREYQI